MPRPPAAFSPFMTTKSTACDSFKAREIRDHGVAARLAHHIAQKKNRQHRASIVLKARIQPVIFRLPLSLALFIFLCSPASRRRSPQPSAADSQTGRRWRNSRRPLLTTSSSSCSAASIAPTTQRSVSFASDPDAAWHSPGSRRADRFTLAVSLRPLHSPDFPDMAPARALPRRPESGVLSGIKIALDPATSWRVGRKWKSLVQVRRLRPRRGREMR